MPEEGEILSYLEFSNWQHCDICNTAAKKQMDFIF